MRSGALEILGIAMVGEGIVGLASPSRYSTFWKVGPKQIRETADKLSHHPNIVRGICAAEAVLGFWLATSQLKKGNGKSDQEAGQMNTTSTGATLSSGDRQFMEKAARAGMSEIEAAKMALSRSGDQRVRSFAERMIHDHEQADQKLKRLATEKKVALPDQPSEDQQNTKDDLTRYNGDEFDSQYIGAQIKAHEKVIEFFREESGNGSDPDVKSFATDTLPVLKEHLRMAESISERQ